MLIERGGLYAAKRLHVQDRPDARSERRTDAMRHAQQVGEFAICLLSPARPWLRAQPSPCPNLLALSFEGELAPSLDLRCLHAGRKLPDGWGIGYYPGGEPSASLC